MAYRGEDVPGTHGDWGRQPPWQSSSGAAPGSTGARDGGSPDYAGDENYPPHDGGGFGYGPDGGYPGPGPQGYGPQDGPYGQQAYEQQSYEQYNGYGQGQGGAGGYGGPRRDDYGYDHGRGQNPSLGYDQAGYDQRPPPGYTSGGGYQEPGGGYEQAPAYRAPSPGGGYPPSRGASGGYPALPSGQGDYPAEDAGNDWYGGQPAAANGASFADTGSYRLNGRVIDEYGTGPREALHDPVRGYPPGPGQQGTGPQPFTRTGSQSVAETRQQERYEEPVGYPGYGQDGRGSRPGASGGFQAPEGRDALDPRGGYPPGDDYAAGDDYATAAYGRYDGPSAQSAAPAPDRYTDYGDGFDGYDAGGDPYQDRYGDGPHTGGAGRGPGKGPGGRAAGPLRGKRLLFAALGVVAVGILGAAAYVFVLKPSSPAGNSNTSRALPSSGAQPSQQACVKELGTYCHIEAATDDPTLLTPGELYPPAFTNEKDKTSYSLVSTKMDKTCGNAVIGSDLVKALKTGKCTQVVRASYVSGDNKIMGTIGVINLATTNGAHYAGRVVGQNDFIAPLTSKKGVASKLGNGTGIVDAKFKGHYLILTWSEFVDGTDPKTKTQDTQLEQFSNDLVTGTANIDLSQRMVTGSAPTPAAS